MDNSSSSPPIIVLHVDATTRLPFGPGNAVEPLLEQAPEQLVQSVIEAAWQETLRLSEVHGPDAFLEPRERAAAHEAGHAVLEAALGRRVTDCRVREVGGRTWVGNTDTDAGPWCISPLTDPADDVLHIARMFAGVAGESVAGVRHEVSGLDERIAAELLTHTVATKLSAGSTVPLEVIFGRLFKLVEWDVDRILRNNADVHAELTAYLGRRRIARAYTLERILGNVRRGSLTNPRVVLEAQPPR